MPYSIPRWPHMPSSYKAGAVLQLLPAMQDHVPCLDHVSSSVSPSFLVNLLWPFLIVQLESECNS